MGRCLPRYLVISFLIVVFGLVLVWIGSRPQTLTQIPSPTPSVSETFGLEGERILVTEVVDGDTIKIEGNKTVRLLGIDTPETKDPRKPVQCFGKEASNKTRELVRGKQVILEKDVSETDKYGRLLRYIYLPLEDNRLLFVNDYLIREGYARVLTYPPDVKYTEQFLEAQQEAKESSRGLWGRC